VRAGNVVPMNSTNFQSVVVGTFRHGVAAALLLVVGAIGGEMTQGRDLGQAVGNGLLVMLWVGWVYVLIAMGIGAVFLALLYGVVAQITRLTWWLAVGFSVVVWTCVALALLGYIVATNSLSPGSRLTVDGVVIGLFQVAGIGAVFGLVEGSLGLRRSISRADQAR
jgi:hypothetical protein